MLAAVVRVLLGMPATFIGILCWHLGLTSKLSFLLMHSLGESNGNSRHPCDSPGWSPGLLASA